MAFAAIIDCENPKRLPNPVVGSGDGEKVPASWKRILAFAGLRGAVSIALVLSVPESNYKGTLQTMVFGVALLSLIVQAEILQKYVRKESPEKDY